jgi:glycosyltransferase involved in cell wall biosynthesis
MNILMVNTYHYARGGDSRHALDLSERLTAAGHRVVPFAMREARNLPSQHERWFADEVDYPSLMAQRGVRGALKVLTTSIYNRQARRRLAALLAEQPVELAHLHSVMHHLTASVVLELYRRNVPVVWTLHDLKSVCPTTRMLREGAICELCRHGRFHHALRTRCKRGSLGASAIVTVELYLHRIWRVYERARLLIAPSQFLRDKILEHGLRPARIEVVPNPVDLDAHSPAQGDDGFALFVGRLDPEKGVETLLRAAARARVPLKIAGSGELETPLQQLAAREGWSNVQFLGHCGGERLRALYRGARLLVMPSACYENCPLVVLEAFASGKPVLASRLGGLPELVQEERTGRLLPAGDVDAWAGGLAAMMESPQRCAAMGKEARRFVERRHAPQEHLERIMQLYQEARAGTS